MAQPAVVVAFSSRCGATETLAHAAAVGVVNGRGLPRLRRLADEGEPTPAGCLATLQRMQKEYVTPTEADIAASPALIIVPSAGMTPASDVSQPFMAMLHRIAAAAGPAGKLGAVVDAGDRHTVAAFASALEACGFTLIATSGDPRAHGRAVVDALALHARTDG
jgi:hypothetical protein